MSTNTRETNAGRLWNYTPVRGYTKSLPVQFKYGHVVRTAEARRAPGDHLKHGLEFGRRSADDLKNFRCGRLLFLRLVTFAGKSRDLGFRIGTQGTTVARSL
jgi:hypothetical protein